MGNAAWDGDRVTTPSGIRLSCISSLSWAQTSAGPRMVTASVLWAWYSDCRSQSWTPQP